MAVTAAPYRWTLSNPLTAASAERFVGEKVQIGVNRRGWLKGTIVGLETVATSKKTVVLSLKTDIPGWTSIPTADVRGIVVEDAQ